MSDARNEPTGQQVRNACISFRHDYGLMDDMQRAELELEAVMWFRAWRKELLSNEERSMGDIRGINGKPIKVGDTVRINSAIDGVIMAMVIDLVCKPYGDYVAVKRDGKVSVWQADAVKVIAEAPQPIDLSKVVGYVSINEALHLFCDAEEMRAFLKADFNRAGWLSKEVTYHPKQQ